MSVSKPTLVPDWASSTLGVSRTLNPPDVIDGWAPGYKPPAQYVNFLLNNNASWMKWLQAFENQSHEWLGVQTFDAGIIVSNPGVNGQAVAATCSATGSSGINATATATGATAIKAAGTGGGLGMAVTGGANIDLLTAAMPTPTPIYPTLPSGYANQASQRTHYYKTADGIVHLYVAIQDNSGVDHSGGVILNLPAGYRPQMTISGPAFTGQSGGANIWDCGFYYINPAGGGDPGDILVRSSTSQTGGRLLDINFYVAFNPSATY